MGTTDLDKLINPTEDYQFQVSRGLIDGVELYNKFGSIPDVDSGSPVVDVWAYSTKSIYLGFNATVGEAITIIAASGQNAGTLLSSGTATLGSNNTRLVDTGATFITDTVAVGDLLINDTQLTHGVITSVISETVIDVMIMTDGEAETIFINDIGDSYRIATTNGTGAAVVKIQNLLDLNYDGYYSEYVITNGGTGVDTVGTDYIRNSRAKVILAGSGAAVATGLQAHQKTTTANVFWEIQDGHNQTRIAADTVPRDRTIYASINIQMSRTNGTPGSAEVVFLVRKYGEVFQDKTPMTITDSQSYASVEKKTLVIEQFSDFKWSIPEVSDNNTQLAGEINGFIVENRI